MTENDPVMPTDTPLLRVLGDLENDGYESQFVPRPDGAILCRSGGHEFRAIDVLADRERRLEGVSDPADMLIVYALRCPICGLAGTLVLHYGPEASAEEADVLVDIDVRPARASIIPDTS